MKRRNNSLIGECFAQRSFCSIQGTVQAVHSIYSISAFSFDIHWPEYAIYIMALLERNVASSRYQLVWKRVAVFQNVSHMQTRGK